MKQSVKRLYGKLNSPEVSIGLLVISGVATLLFVLAIENPHRGFMLALLNLVHHTNHINDPGREHHFEALATEMMWRYIFSAVTIGWCLAVGVAYLLAGRDDDGAKAGGVRKNTVLTVDERLALTAFARNPFAFGRPLNVVDAQYDFVGQVQGQLQRLMEMPVEAPVAVRSDKSLEVAGTGVSIISGKQSWFEKTFANHYETDTRNRIALIGTIGLIVLMGSYAIARLYL